MSHAVPSQGATPESQAPPTYLGWAIATMALCFLPLGLVGAYHSWRTSECSAAGDGAEAAQHSMKARRWIVAAFVVGALVDLGVLVSLGLLGAFPSGSGQ
ncbi:MAG: hypothetical protein F2793_01580 [Actinobacteria bacterium]|uniref:Unannotated protein n=1 Tax=freshwater metagenome TaxID=449393 RepID=A0A6J7CWT4_9ZZZZ|nr:hypothetical protein [Actinomycetota bacterium]